MPEEPKPKRKPRPAKKGSVDKAVKVVTEVVAAAAIIYKAVEPLLRKKGRK